MMNSGLPALSENAKDVLDLFDGYNMKMVLQGHNHVYMVLFINGVHFISGGSTAYNDGINNFNDGFIRVLVKDKRENIEFIQTNRPISMGE